MSYWCPSGQEHFKQSASRLALIANRVLDMSHEIFKYPYRMVDEISALGLRHVGYAVPIEYFGPFVSSCIETLQAEISGAEGVMDSFAWSLGLVSPHVSENHQRGINYCDEGHQPKRQRSLAFGLGMCSPRSSGWMGVDHRSWHAIHISTVLGHWKRQLEIGRVDHWGFADNPSWQGEVLLWIGRLVSKAPWLCRNTGDQSHYSAVHTLWWHDVAVSSSSEWAEAGQLLCQAHGCWPTGKFSGSSWEPGHAQRSEGCLTSLHHLHDWPHLVWYGAAQVCFRQCLAVLHPAPLRSESWSPQPSWAARSPFPTCKGLLMPLVDLPGCTARLHS